MFLHKERSLVQNYVRLVMTKRCYHELWWSRVPRYLSRPVQKQIFSSTKHTLYGPFWLHLRDLLSLPSCSGRDQWQPVWWRNSRRLGQTLRTLHKPRCPVAVMQKQEFQVGSDPAGWCYQARGLRSLSEDTFNDVSAHGGPLPCSVILVLGTITTVRSKLNLDPWWA